MIAGVSNNVVAYGREKHKVEVWITRFIT